MVIKEILHRAECEVQKYALDNMSIISASELGEIYNADFFVNDECIITDNVRMRKQLLHYAGFEYLDEEYVEQIGRFTVFHDDGLNEDGEDGYVREIIRKWKEKA